MEHPLKTFYMAAERAGFSQGIPSPELQQVRHEIREEDEIAPAPVETKNKRLDLDAIPRARRRTVKKQVSRACRMCGDECSGECRDQQRLREAALKHLHTSVVEDVHHKHEKMEVYESFEDHEEGQISEASESSTPLSIYDGAEVIEISARSSRPLNEEELIRQRIFTQQQIEMLKLQRLQDLADCDQQRVQNVLNPVVALLEGLKKSGDADCDAVSEIQKSLTTIGKKRATPLIGSSAFSRRENETELAAPAPRTCLGVKTSAFSTRPLNAPSPDSVDDGTSENSLRGRTLPQASSVEEGSPMSLLESLSPGLERPTPPVEQPKAEVKKKGKVVVLDPQDAGVPRVLMTHGAKSRITLPL